MSVGLAFQIDLQPSLEVRLEAGLVLLRVCQKNDRTQDYNLMADVCRRADLIMYGDASDSGPAPMRSTAFQLFEFLTANGMDSASLMP